MSLTSWSLTWPALLVYFILFSLPQCFTAQWEDKCNYSNWRMSRRTPSCTDKHLADHHFLLESKITLPAAYSQSESVLLHQTDSEACHALSHPHCFLHGLLPFFPFSFLLANFYSNYQAGIFLPSSKMGWVPERILSIEIHRTLKSLEVGYACLYKS